MPASTKIVAASRRAHPRQAVSVASHTLRMDTTDSGDSFWSALLRAFWMLLGHAASIVLALSIAAQPSWSIGWRDIAYWLCISSVVATRWLDVLHYGGTTGTGDPE